MDSSCQEDVFRGLASFEVAWDFSNHGFFPPVLIVRLNTCSGSVHCFYSLFRF